MTKEEIELNKFKARLLSQIKDMTKDLPFYSCGFVDPSEQDGYLKMFRLGRPIHVQQPIYHDEVDEHGKVEIGYITKTGFYNDNMCTVGWSALAAENLVRIVPVLRRAIEKCPQGKNPGA